MGCPPWNISGPVLNFMWVESHLNGPKDKEMFDYVVGFTPYW